MWKLFALTVLVLLGQGLPTDNVATSGWVSAGLLGSAPSWLLLVHLPAKDKQVKDLLEMFRVEMKEQREAAGNVAATSSAAMASAVSKIEQAMEDTTDAVGKNGTLLVLIQEEVKKLNGGKP